MSAMPLRLSTTLNYDMSLLLLTAMRFSILFGRLGRPPFREKTLREKDTHIYKYLCKDADMHARFIYKHTHSDDDSIRHINSQATATTKLITRHGIEISRAAQDRAKQNFVGTYRTEHKAM